MFLVRYCKKNIDKLLEYYSSPTFIKVDVEGSEGLVMDGGDKVFSKIKPILYIEVGTENLEYISRSLHSYKYKIFDGDIIKQKKRRTVPMHI